MYYDYDDADFYEDESLEMIIGELESAFKRSIKKQITDEMSRLKKENEKLQKIKDKWEEKIREIDAIKKQTEEELKKATLHDILSLISSTFYMIGQEYEYTKDKCDKCDEERRIHYLSPLGREMIEECECSEKEWINVPKEVEVFKICQKYRSESPKDIGIYYRYNEQESYYSCNIYKNQSFEEVDTYNLLFRDKKKAQEYCDYLNEKRKHRIN